MSPLSPFLTFLRDCGLRGVWVPQHQALQLLVYPLSQAVQPPDLRHTMRLCVLESPLPPPTDKGHCPVHGFSAGEQPKGSQKQGQWETKGKARAPRWGPTLPPRSTRPPIPGEGQSALSLCNCTDPGQQSPPQITLGEAGHFSIPRPFNQHPGPMYKSRETRSQSYGRQESAGCIVREGADSGVK